MVFYWFLFNVTQISLVRKAVAKVIAMGAGVLAASKPQMAVFNNFPVLCIVRGRNSSETSNRFLSHANCKSSLLKS